MGETHRECGDVDEIVLEDHTDGWNGIRPDAIAASPRTNHLTTDFIGSHRPGTPPREWLRCRVGG